MRVVITDGGRADAGMTGVTRDCVVRAIAIALERPYLQVYADLFNRSLTARRSKHNKRKSPRHGVRRAFFEPYLRDAGWTFTPCMTIGSGCRVHMREHELPSGRLVVTLSKHLAAVIDGVVYDTHDCTRGGSRCVYGYYAPKRKEA